ncbi:MAG: GDP-mannose 4,6-dehydratase, partial [Pyrinomonadaceae bacterium]
MKILITGGAGFIGSHLSDKLMAEGHEITVIDDLSTGRYSNIEHLSDKANFRLIIDTVLNASLMEELIRDTDRVYHMA